MNNSILNNGVCPHCGHCPTCGRNNGQIVSPWYQPAYPYYTTYCGGTNSLTSQSSQLNTSLSTESKCNH